MNIHCKIRGDYKNAWSSFILEKFPPLRGNLSELNFRLETGVFQFWTDEIDWKILRNDFNFVDRKEHIRYELFTRYIENYPEVSHS